MISSHPDCRYPSSARPPLADHRLPNSAISKLAFVHVLSLAIVFHSLFFSSFFSSFLPLDVVASSVYGPILIRVSPMLLRSSTRERTLLPRRETSFITTYISLYRYYSNFGTKCLSQSITVIAEQSRSISSIDNKIYVHARTSSPVRKQKQEIGMIEEEIRFYEGRP